MGATVRRPQRLVTFLFVVVFVGTLTPTATAGVRAPSPWRAATPQDEILRGPTALDAQWQALQAAAPAAEPDTDADGLKDAVERILGTNPTERDTEFDGLDDRAELAAGTDPRRPDSNLDGLSDGAEIGEDGVADLDGDGLANAWDDDNDADGVPDAADLSPLAGPATDDPVDAVRVEYKGNGRSTTLDLQVVPADASHLRLAGDRWNWPADTKGQMQDDDATPDDVTLIPLLEVIPSDMTGFRAAADQLEDEYGILVSPDDATEPSFVVERIALGNLDGQGDGLDLRLVGRNASTLTGVHSVAVGGGYACATVIRAGTPDGQPQRGEAWCWGARETLGAGNVAADSAEPWPVALPGDIGGVPIWVKLDAAGSAVRPGWIAAGSNHACLVSALQGGAKVWCWGDDTSGQVSPPVTPELPRATFADPVPLDRSAYRYSRSGYLVVNGISGLAAGGQHSCAWATYRFIAGSDMWARDELTCWGDNSEGQLSQGYGGGPAITTPVPVLVGAGVFGGGGTIVGTGSFYLPRDLAATRQTVAAGLKHTCAIVSLKPQATQGPADRRVVCWGANRALQVGPASYTTMVPEPKVVTLVDDPAVVDDTIPVALSATGNRTCVLTQAGTVQCWGDLAAPHAVDLGPGVRADGLELGTWHMCIHATTGEVRCIGSNYAGQLGGTPSPDTGTAITLTAAAGATSIAVGADTSCAATEAGVASCWGANDRRQAGQETVSAAIEAPTPIDQRELVMTGTDLARWPGGPGPAADWTRATECVNQRALVGGAVAGRSSACVATAEPRGASRTIPTTHRNVALADIDKDGAGEYVVSGIDEATGRLRFQVGDVVSAGRRLRFTWGVVRESPPLPLGDAGGGAAVADVDGDGVLDLVYLAVDDAAAHRFHYLVGWSLDRQGKPGSWSGTERLPGASTADRLYVPLAPARTADGTTRAFTGRVPLPASLGTSVLTLDARLVWAVQGRTDHPDIDGTIMLARYGESFSLTGLSANEHHGTDVAAFSPTVGDPDRRYGLATAAAVAFGEEFLKGGRPVRDLDAVLTQYAMPLGDWERRMAWDRPAAPIPDDNAGVAALDAMAAAILEAVPEATVVPVWVGVESRVRLLGLQDVPVLNGTVYRVRLGDLPVATIKTAKLNFYDTTGDVDEVVVGAWARSLDAFDLDEARTATLALLATWSAGQTRLTHVGGVPVPIATNADAVVLKFVKDVIWGLTKLKTAYGLFFDNLSEVKSAIKDFNRLVGWGTPLASIPDSALVRVRAVIGATDDSARASAMLRKQISISWARHEFLNSIGTFGDGALAFATFFLTWSTYGWSTYGSFVAMTTLVIDLAAIVAGVALACLWNPLSAVPAIVVAVTAWIFGWQDDLANWVARVIVGVEAPLAEPSPHLGRIREEIDDVDGNGLDVGDHVGFAGDFYPREHAIRADAGGSVRYGTAEDLDYTAVYDARLFWTPPSEPHPRLGTEETLRWSGDWDVSTFPVQYRRPVASWITPGAPSTDLAASFGLHWLSLIRVWRCQQTCWRQYTSVGSTTDENGGDFGREQGNLIEMHYDVMPGDLAGFLAWAAVPALDADHDGRPNGKDGSPLWDADGDGIADGIELELETDPAARDSDGDGLPDGCAADDAACVVSEMRMLTDPLDPDTDGDGLTDGEEIAGWDVAIDYRGLALAVRVTSDPTLANSDDDGLADATEASEGLNPRSRDTDGDGIDDPEWGVERIPVGDDTAQVVDVSADGQLVVFDTSARLVTADTDDLADVYRFDRGSRQLTLVSRQAAYGEHVTQPSVSDNGRFIAFRAEYYTGPSGLVYRAVVVHDTVTNASTALNASITCAPAGPGLTAANAALCADLATVLASTDEDVSAPTISGNGRFVAYVVHDVGTPRQVLVHDRQTGTTRIASVAPDGGGPHPECEDHGGYLSYASFDPALSDDGSVIVFTTACEQPYVVALDLTDGTMVDVRPAPGVAASQPDVSGDGRFVAVVTGVDNADDDGVVAVFDRQEGTFAELLATGRHPAVDEHGVRVVFQSTRAIGDGSREVILSATASPAQVTVVSMPLDGMAPNGDSVAPAIADDGGVAAWSSLASDLIAGDTNDAWDVFVRALD